LFAWLTRAVCITVVLAVGAQPGTLRAAPPSETDSPLTITPTRLDFGSQAVDTDSPRQTVTLTNSGHSELKITAILTSGIDFTQTNTCGTSLAMGAGCTIEVSFRPAIPGPRIGTLNLFDSAPANPQSVALLGTGQ
jgi:hypothetical protein